MDRADVQASLSRIRSSLDSWGGRADVRPQLSPGGDAVVFVIPLHVRNPNNGSHGRGHWGVTKRRNADHLATRLCANTARLKSWASANPSPYLVTLTRIGRGKMDLHDAVPASLKAVVDELAQHLGVNDGDLARVSWRYEQERGEYAVRVRVEGRPTP